MVDSRAGDEDSGGAPFGCRFPSSRCRGLGHAASSAVLAVGDVYDEFTTNRVYRSTEPLGMLRDEAVRRLQDKDRCL